MKESRKVAKDGDDSPFDLMKEMRERYDRAVEADQDNRALAIDDLRFVTVPGNQWDAVQRKARKGRPCYEFPILRSHWRQVVNDQKKARPGIKIRPVEDGDVEDQRQPERPHAVALGPDGIHDQWDRNQRRHDRCARVDHAGRDVAAQACAHRSKRTAA